MLDIELFKKIPFFQNFEQHLIDIVNTVSRLEKIPADEILLEQGALNFELFFLVKGKVVILVDDHEVLEIADNGQVFGEMSIVSHDTCAATVKTKTECYVVKIPINDLQSLPKEHKDAVLKDVYKSCAEILARKLSDTNQLAKKYKNQAG